MGEADEIDAELFAEGWRACRARVYSQLFRDVRECPRLTRDPSGLCRKCQREARERVQATSFGSWDANGAPV